MKRLMLITFAIVMSVLLVSFVSAADPVVYFSFDSSATECAGAEAEVSGTVEIVDGKVGKAASFDGSASTITVTDSYDNLPKSTFMAWVKTEGTISDYFSIFSGPWEGSNVHFNITSSGVIEIGVNSTMWIDGRVSMTPVNDGDWHHIAVTFDIEGEMMNIYIDGELDSECDMIEENGLNFSNFTIGSWNASRYFNGLIDEIRIYDSILPESEIKSLASGTAPAATVSEPIKEAEPETQPVQNQPDDQGDTAVDTPPLSIPAASEPESTAPVTSDTAMITGLIALAVSAGMFAGFKKKK